LSPTSVTLTAAATGGSVFTGWSGDCSGTVPTCTVNVNGYISVGASFDTPPPSVQDQTIINVTAGGPNKFNLTDPGDYKLVGYVMSPQVDNGANSFYIDLDADPSGSLTNYWNFNDVGLANTWNWQTVFWPAANPKVWTGLTAGIHSLYINTRETGAQIQKIQFLKNVITPSLHPADGMMPGTTADNKISIDEATGYNACWRAAPNQAASCPGILNLDYAVRAGFLFQGDPLGVYRFDSSKGSCPLCWQPGTTP
jgi:hypothetical protein